MRSEGVPAPDLPADAGYCAETSSMRKAVGEEVVRLLDQSRGKTG